MDFCVGLKVKTDGGIYTITACVGGGLWELNYGVRRAHERDMTVVKCGEEDTL